MKQEWLTAPENLLQMKVEPPCGDIERQRRAKDLFERVVDFPPADRDAILGALCADDVEVRSLVDALLAADSNLGGLFSRPRSIMSAIVGGGDAPAEHTGGEQPGEWVDEYRLLEIIGRGGFGTVWMAERSDAQGKVAVKVLKAGMDTAEVLARFGAEREVLLMMDHPNIARVLDSGSTFSGRPFFVMELVHGPSITAYCDEKRLSILDRLNLFSQVCSAVQHAHTKGVIHRDLKPANVLVEELDGEPRVKVIDFGIAKAIHGRVSQATLFTRFHAILGTPQYMSPEQAEDGGPNVDTRSDVYSLGALLYELLSGLPPFDETELGEDVWNGFRRLIREREPVTPSIRLARYSGPIRRSAGESSRSSPASSLDIAVRRSTTVAQLTRLLRLELDWIPQKAMRKERDRRYQSPSELASDISLYRAGLPILAAPESRAYRFRKLLRRHRAAIGAGSAMALLLVAGLVGTTYGLIRERRQREIAQTKQAETEQIAQFQTQMLDDVDITRAGARLREFITNRYREAMGKSSLAEAERSERIQVMEREVARISTVDSAVAVIDGTILAPAADVVQSRFADNMLLSAALQETLAGAYHRIGLDKKALPLQERALTLRQTALGEANPETIRSLNELSTILHALGRLADAEQHQRRAAKLSQQLFGDDDVETLQALKGLSQALQDRGELDEAERIIRQVLDKETALMKPDNPDRIRTVAYLGSVLSARSQFASAEPYLREALERRRATLGNEHIDTITSVTSLARLLLARGKTQEALPLYQEAYDLSRRVRGEDHPRTWETMSNLAGALVDTGAVKDAEVLYRDAIKKSTALVGEDHPSTLSFVSNLAVLLKKTGRLDDAEPLYREVLDKRRLIYGPDHPETASAMSNLAMLLHARKRFDEALPLLVEARRVGLANFDDSHHTVLTFTLNLALVTLDSGNAEDAERYYRQVADRAQAKFGEIHRTTLMANNGLATALVGLRRFEEGCRVASGAATISAAKLGSDSPLARMIVENAAKCFDEWDKAVPGQGHDSEAAAWRARLSTRSVNPD